MYIFSLVEAFVNTACEVADSTTIGNFLQKGATNGFGKKTRDMIIPSSTFLAGQAMMRPVWHPPESQC